MESNKFDNGIKETLENRRLQPSKESWNKLSQQLDSQNKKQRNKSIWFIGVAASLVGLLFVAFQFLYTKEMTPKITEIPIITQPESTVVATEITDADNAILKKTQPLENTENHSFKTTIPTIAKERMLPKENKKLVEPDEEVQKNLTLEAQKIETIVAKVNDLKNNNQTVTDHYIEALLDEAQKEIRLQKLQDQTTHVVDASLLLQQVETDLDQSFRSKVFEAIKASYTTVKTVVAQRND